MLLAPLAHHAYSNSVSHYPLGACFQVIVLEGGGHPLDLVLTDTEAGSLIAPF
jgi:hypothetical protein